MSVALRTAASTATSRTDATERRTCSGWEGRTAAASTCRRLAPGCDTHPVATAFALLRSRRSSIRERAAGRVASVGAGASREGEHAGAGRASAESCGRRRSDRRDERADRTVGGPRRALHATTKPAPAGARRRSSRRSSASARTPATPTPTMSLEFVTWAERGGCPEPAAVDHRTLRRYLAYLDTRGSPARSIARKAAALRAYLRYLRRHGVIDHDPGRTPARRRRARAGCLGSSAPTRPTTCSTTRDRSPSRATPTIRWQVAVVLRDLAVLEVLYGAGLRVAECCGLRHRRLRPARAVSSPWSARARRSGVCPIGEPALDALAAWLERGRPEFATSTRRRTCRVPQPAWPRAHSA